MALERSGASFIESTPTPGRAPSSLPSPLHTLTPKMSQSESPPKPNPKPSENTSVSTVEAKPDPVVTQKIEPSTVESVLSEAIAPPAVFQEVKIEPVQKREVEKPRKSESSLKNNLQAVEKIKQSPEISARARSVEDIPKGEVLAAQVSAAETEDSSLWLYILALIGVLGVGSMAVVLMQGDRKTKEADSYTIVE